MPEHSEEKQPTIENIRDFWESRARALGSDCTATLGEVSLHKMEIRSISRFLQDNLKIIDIGCGNGYATMIYASTFNSSFLGLDYSPEMIKHAKLSLEQKNAHIKPRLQFDEGDVLNLNLPKETFDIAITSRCIQNLPTFDLQTSALRQIHRILKIDSLYIMNECSITGLNKLNSLRRLFGKKPLEGVMPWHNLFIDDAKLLEILPTIGFELRKIINFSSTYMILTKAFGRPFSYIKRIISYLPAVLDYGYDKIYVLQKKRS
jgi:ubiquinone/menaquinone biosynthesis C-methylase UbiE